LYLRALRERNDRDELTSPSPDHNRGTAGIALLRKLVVLYLNGGMIDRETMGEGAIGGVDDTLVVGVFGDHEVRGRNVSAARQRPDVEIVCIDDPW